jgi:hypothetical protein
VQGAVSNGNVIDRLVSKRERGGEREREEKERERKREGERSK